MTFNRWTRSSVAEPDPPTSVETETDALPAQHALRSIYPNPFNPSTSIRFDLAAAGQAQVTVYDVRGARVARLLDEHRDRGSHQVRWDGRDGAGRRVASGVYLVRLRIDTPEGAVDETRRVTLLR